MTPNEIAVLCFYLMILATVIIYDVAITNLTGWNTISKVTFEWGERMPWLPWVVLIGMLILWWHLFVDMWPFGRR